MRLGEVQRGTGWGQKPKTEPPELSFGERNTGAIIRVEGTWLGWGTPGLRHWGGTMG